LLTVSRKIFRSSVIPVSLGVTREEATAAKRLRIENQPRHIARSGIPQPVSIGLHDDDKRNGPETNNGAHAGGRNHRPHRAPPWGEEERHRSGCRRAQSERQGRRQAHCAQGAGKQPSAEPRRTASLLRQHRTITPNRHRRSSPPDSVDDYPLRRLNFQLARGRRHEPLFRLRARARAGAHSALLDRGAGWGSRR
jgi:hypothetical protein